MEPRDTIHDSGEIDGRRFTIEVRPSFVEGQPLALAVRYYGKGHWRLAEGQPNFMTEREEAMHAGNVWLKDGRRPNELPPTSGDAINTHGYVMQVGKHRGELITRVPVGYLKWMVRDRHREARYAQAELDRRGTVTPDIEISGHAIDSASLRVRKIWHETRGEDEGLHAWLVRRAQAALAADSDGNERIEHDGIIFVFELTGEWPLLKTVMRAKGGAHAASAREEVIQ